MVYRGNRDIADAGLGGGIHRGGNALGRGHAVAADDTTKGRICPLATFVSLIFFASTRALVTADTSGMI